MHVWNLQRFLSQLALLQAHAVRKKRLCTGQHLYDRKVPFLSQLPQERLSHPDWLLPDTRWEAWKKMGCLASEMESAALFIAAGKLRARAGSCFLVLANQEREKLGLDNPVVHDTDMAIQVAVEAVRKLIREDSSN